MVEPGVTHAERLEAAGRTAGEERNVATVREIIKGFAASDFTVLRSKLAPNASTWVVGFSAETLGKNFGDPGFVPRLFNNGMCFDIKQVAAEGNVVCVEWDDEAITSRGDRYHNTGVSLFTFDDSGNVLAYREYINPQNFFDVM
jgi:ketosteroid isomerase-like protein